MKKACIVLPTYNESENIQILLPQIFQQQEFIRTHELHVLVVDDKSPDGTGHIVEQLKCKYSNLHLLTGDKTGLGEAYKRGISHALSFLSPELIIQMDADLQHSPTLLPTFIGLQSYGFSMVIGSRFVLGGSTPNFSINRRMLSIAGNWMLRVFGGLPDIRDCTSGFRCIKADLIKKCDLTELSTKGYSFQSSLLFELLRNGAKLIEVPITFTDRKIGESKLNLSDKIEFLHNVLRIRFRKSRELFAFLTVGLSGVFVNLVLYYVLTRFLNMRMELASPIAIETSIITNFLFNNMYTFRKRQCGNSLIYRFSSFHLIAGIAGLANYSILLLFNKVFGLMDMISCLFGIIFGTLINYILNSRITWKNKKNEGLFAIDR